MAAAASLAAAESTLKHYPMTDREEVGALPLLPNRTSAAESSRPLSRRWFSRDALLAEVLEVRGLMPLLMKRRNGAHWTGEERRVLRQQLRALMHFVPWLVILLLPGSALLIPLFAWWLDRRRHGPRGGTG
jgi:hypothetical protein